MLIKLNTEEAEMIMDCLTERLDRLRADKFFYKTLRLDVREADRKIKEIKAIIKKIAEKNKEEKI